MRCDQCNTIVTCDHYCNVTGGMIYYTDLCDNTFNSLEYMCDVYICDEEI